MEYLRFSNEKIPIPLGNYSHVVKAGNFVHFCGIGARCPETGKEVGVTLNERNQMVSYDITAQTRQVLDNLKTLLQNSGCKWEELVDVTVMLADMRDFLKYNQVYNEYFIGEHVPVRTTIQANPPGQSYVLIKAVAYQAPS